MEIMLLETVAFALERHGKQPRKYTGDPYVIHPVGVAIRLHKRIASLYAYLSVREALQAAILHDVLEDTPTTYAEIAKRFGHGVAGLVLEVTDQFTDPAFGNRATRKARERDRLAQVSGLAQCIKLADLEDNTESIVAHDPNFARVYLLEKLALLEVLTNTPRLWREELEVHTREEFERSALNIKLYHHLREPENYLTEAALRAARA